MLVHAADILCGLVSSLSTSSPHQFAAAGSEAQFVRVRAVQLRHSEQHRTLADIRAKEKSISRLRTNFFLVIPPTIRILTCILLIVLHLLYGLLHLCCLLLTQDKVMQGSRWTSIWIMWYLSGMATSPDWKWTRSSTRRITRSWAAVEVRVFSSFLQLLPFISSNYLLSPDVSLLNSE